MSKSLLNVLGFLQLKWQACRPFMSKSLVKTLGLVALAAVVTGGYIYGPSLAAFAWHGFHFHAAAASKPAAAAPIAHTDSHPAPPVAIDLSAAIGQGLVQAEFIGNGREKMHFSATSKSSHALRLHLAAGLIFQDAGNCVVLLRPHDMDLKAGELKQDELQTAATSTSNEVADAPYSLTNLGEPKLAALLGYLEKHPEVSQGAAQTAVLALKENLPVSAFAKFVEAGSGDIPSKFDTTAFKVDVADIVSALALLREIGVPDEQLALTIDSQLKIEAMIDPLSHAAAMRYYGITEQTEWAFWKHHLLEGDPSTRHYALYGIARFYPDIALQMLPAWVREPRTNAVYRISAVQALAETQRDEALPILRQFEQEFGMETEIGKAAHNAASVLQSRLNKNAAGKIVFHATASTVPGQLALK